MTATTDQISQYRPSIKSLRNRQRWLAMRVKRQADRVAQSKKPAPDRSSLYFLVAVLLLSLAGLAAAGVPPRIYDAPSPSSIRICVLIFPPFVLPAAWRSMDWYDLYGALPGFSGPPMGMVYTGANATAIDGAFPALAL